MNFMGFHWNLRRLRDFEGFKEFLETSMDFKDPKAFQRISRILRDFNEI